MSALVPSVKIGGMLVVGRIGSIVGGSFESEFPALATWISATEWGPVAKPRGASAWLASERSDRFGVDLDDGLIFRVGRRVGCRAVLRVVLRAWRQAGQWAGLWAVLRAARRAALLVALWVDWRVALWAGRVRLRAELLVRADHRAGVAGNGPGAVHAPLTPSRRDDPICSIPRSDSPTIECNERISCLHRFTNSHTSHTI